jgi:hypothetical protein
VTAELMCPYCLTTGKISYKDEEKRFECDGDNCKEIIAREYANDKETPREIISAFGFRTNGKAVYFASLLVSLYRLAQYWDEFYIEPIDEEGLRNGIGADR